MNHNAKYLCDMLSAAIRDSKAPFPSDAVDWEWLFKTAGEHQIIPLLYPVVREISQSSKGPDESMLRKWKNITLISAADQNRRVKEISKVLSEFSKRQIPVIVLKGLVVRDYYPNPALRTMSDVDLLIHSENSELAKEILRNFNYCITDSIGKHDTFKHAGNMTIEVHTKLTGPRFSDRVKAWEEKVWDKSIPIMINGVQARTLSLEDHLLFLCIHMAAHFIGGGFGLRQLCDFYLYVEHNKNLVCWAYILEKASEFGLESLIAALFAVCEKLFGMQKPQAINSVNIDEEYVDLLIEDIIAGGVFGRSVLDRRASANLISLQRIKRGMVFRLPGSLGRVFLFLFPPRRAIANKYKYLNKYPFLIFAAWIHRLFAILLKKGITIEEKFNYLKSIRSQDISARRLRLLHWLGLE